MTPLEYAKHVSPERYCVLMFDTQEGYLLVDCSNDWQEAQLQLAEAKRLHPTQFFWLVDTEEIS